MFFNYGDILTKSRCSSNHRCGLFLWKTLNEFVDIVNNIEESPMTLPPFVYKPVDNVDNY